MKEMLTFQGFDNRETADTTAAILRGHNIDVVVEQNPSLLDSNFIGQDFSNHILVKLWPEDFERAQKILVDSTVIDMNTVDRNYILFSMSNSELQDVLAEPEEWGAYNYKLATLILTERGAPVSEERLNNLKETHIEALSEQRKLDAGWFIMGYGFSILAILAAFLINPSTVIILFSISAMPGILGIVLGTTILRSKKTLPDGRQVASYDKNAHTHGWAMIVVCILSIAIIILAFRSS